MNGFVRWVVKNPWKIVILAIVVTGVLGSFIPNIDLVTNFEDYLSPDNSAVKALREAEQKYGSATFLRVTVETENTIFDSETLARIDSLRASIAEVEGVDSVEGPLNSQLIMAEEDSIVVDTVAPGGKIPASEAELSTFKERLMESELLVGNVVSSSGKAAALSIELSQGVNDQQVADKIRAIVNDYEGPEEIFIAGLPFMNSVLSDSIMNDLIVLLPLVFVVISFVLFLSFRSLRGVVLPLLVVTLSTIWTIGLMAIIDVPFTLISFILPVILVAVGTAYSIHVLNKYYEISNREAPKEDLIVETATLMFSPVSMAGLTTAAGFLALISSFLVPQRQFGIFAGFGVFVSIIFSLTLLPAILSLLPLQSKRNLGSGILVSLPLKASARLINGFESFVVGRKKSILALFFVILAIFALGTFSVRIDTAQESFLGKDSPITKGLKSLDEEFTGSKQLIVEIDTGRRDGLKDPDVLRKIEKFEEWLKTKEGIRINRTYSLVSVVKELNEKFHGGDPDYYRIPESRNLTSQLLLLFSFQGGGLGQLALGDYSAGEVTALYNSATSTEIAKLNKDVQEYLDSNFGPDIRAEMVGSTRLSAMISSKVISSQLISLVASIVVAGIIVAVITRSLTAGIVSLIPLVLTVLINFGIMGYTGTTLNLATLMVSSIVIGIGIDYAIHFIDRFRLEYEDDKAELEIFSTTLRTTGRGIFYNALALTLGFGVLIFSTFSAVANFGFLMAMTMIISMLSAFTVIPVVLFLLRPGFLYRGKE